MTRDKSSNTWAQRYLDALSEKDILQRTQIHGKPVRRLNDDLIEVACKRMTIALEAVFVATERCCGIMRSEIERAVEYCFRA